MRATLFRLLKTLFALAALAGLGAGSLFLWEHLRARREAQAAADAVEPVKRAANKIVKLGADLAASHGLADEPAVEVAWTPRADAFGRVVPNPRASAEVRAACAGTLRADSARPWPALGGAVKAGHVVGWLDVRVGPQERLDLLTKVNEARLKLRGLDELARLRQERFDLLKDATRSVTRSERDAALVELTETQTQRAVTRAAAEEWQRALDALGAAADAKERVWSQPLTVPAAGEVVEVPVRPGMAVEPGAVVVRVVDRRHALVRLELPPEALVAGPPAEVELFAPSLAPPALEGATNRPEPASPPRSYLGRAVGSAVQVEIASQYSAYFYEVDTLGSEAEGRLGGVAWRPGLFVRGEVKTTNGGLARGTAVAETALLYHDGRALVYVRVGPGRYERREVRVFGRDGGRWVLSEGVAGGERVVVKRAQVLLSEEFRGEADND